MQSNLLISTLNSIVYDCIKSVMLCNLLYIVVQHYHLKYRKFCHTYVARTDNLYNFKMKSSLYLKETKRWYTLHLQLIKYILKGLSM